MQGGTSLVIAWKASLALPGGVFSDASLAISALELDESTTTDMPDGTRLQAGYPARTLSMTLAGNLVDTSGATITAAAAFGPYNSASPFYRQRLIDTPVTVWLGLYPPGAAGTPELLQKFTGTVSGYTCETDGTVALTCVDGSNQLRTITDIPAVDTQPPLNAGLTSEYAVDALLRGATSQAISSWPAQRPSVVLAAGMRTSVWPEVGSLISSITAPQYVPGVFGSALGMNTLQSGGAITAATNWGFASTIAGADLFFETWLTDSTATDIDLIFASALSSATLAADFTITTGAIQLTPSFGDAPTTLASFTLAPGGSYLAARLHWPARLAGRPPCTSTAAPTPPAARQCRPAPATTGSPSRRF
jgi:hypothetical protein